MRILRVQKTGEQGVHQPSGGSVESRSFSILILGAVLDRATPLQFLGGARAWFRATVCYSAQWYGHGTCGRRSVLHLLEALRAFRYAVAYLEEASSDFSP